MITSCATTSAVSADVPSKKANLASLNADDRIGWDRSVGIKGGSPGVKMHVRVFLKGPLKISL